MMNIGQSGCGLGRRVTAENATRARGSIDGWQGRTIMILLLSSLLLFLLLLNLEFLVDLVEFFEGDATGAACRATGRTPCTAQTAS